MPFAQIINRTGLGRGGKWSPYVWKWASLTAPKFAYMLVVPVGPERSKGASKFYLFLLENGEWFCIFSCPRLVPGLSSWSVLSRTNLGQAKDRKRTCKGPHRQKVQIYRIFEIHRFTWYVLISLRHCTPLQIVYRLRRHIIR